MVFFKLQEIIVQILPTACAIGAIVFAAAGFAGSATAQTSSDQIRNIHVMTVRLPDGSLERIRYAGDQPPKVNFEAQRQPFFAVPVFDGIASDSPFAELDRISAMMDREAAAMMQQASSIDRAAFADPQKFLNVDFAKLPSGTQGYSVVSTMSGNNVCTRSVRYFSAGEGKAPRVQTSSSGNCAADANAPKPLQAFTPRSSATPRQSHVIEAGYHPGHASEAVRLAEAKTAGAVDY